MSWFIVIPGVLFAILSTAMLAYISMATMIGPWIAPTLVLISSVLVRFRREKKPQEIVNSELVLIQSIGSVGGAVGMAVGFSLPTLYFLDPSFFTAWLATPLRFCGLLTTVCLVAGGLGICLARSFGDKFIRRDKLPFPVSGLIHSVITSQSQGKEARNLLFGLSITGIFCFLRDGFLAFKGFLPKTIYLLPSVVGRHLPLALFPGPTLWAIGFTTGSVIAIPLLIGMISRYLILYPLNHHASWLPFALFQPMSKITFSLAFCSGLVLSGLAMQMLKFPKTITSIMKSYCGKGMWKKWSLKRLLSFKNQPGSLAIGKMFPASASLMTANNLELLLVLSASVAFLSYMGFSVPSQLFMLALTIMFTYQISLFGARVGLIPFGRFATFVMVPTMLLFRINFLQITILCVFFSVCAGVASDLLFDYKVGDLCNVSFNRVYRYQWLGLIVASLSIGVLLWLFFTTFQIGSPELCAQRGKTRALMIQSISFNYWVLACGFFYGLLIKKLRINPALTLGGILMPNSISIGLIIGGLSAKICKKPKRYFPFWSGVFACESLWILLCMIVKLVAR